MKRHFLAASFLLGTAGAALAADPSEPVKTLFDIASGKTQGELFDEQRLSSVFSKSFADTYRIAAKVTEMAEVQEGLFDYDPLVGGQDGCELKDMSFKALPPVREGEREYVPVDATFDNMRCFQGFENNPLRTLRFRVVEENGRFVVDDYENGMTDDKDRPLSLKEQLVRGVAGTIRNVAGLALPE